MKSNNRFGRKGFTLVETMIVVTIFAFIGLGLGLSFISGIKIWNRAKNTDLAYSYAILEFETITKELRHSIEIPLINFKGKDDSVSFPTVKDNEVIEVTYEFDSFKKVLLRKQIGLVGIMDSNIKADTKEREIVKLDDFSLQYFYFDKDEEEYLWTDEWEEGIFLALEIKAKVGDKDIIKAVFLPIGKQ